MATAKRKQEELGEECEDQEPHDNDPCSDEEEPKRPRLDLHHQHISHHPLPHHRQWSLAAGAKHDACDNSEVKDNGLIDIEAESERNYRQMKFNTSEQADNSCYFNTVYPEYLVPRQFCAETDEAPCDLSNWAVRSSDGVRPASEGDSDRRNSDNSTVDDNSQQPINFAYYHF